MRQFTSQLLDPLFDGFRHWIPTSISRISTIAADASDEKDSQEKQGAENGVTDDAASEGPSGEPESLESFSSFRISSESIDFTSSKPHRSGGKAEVVQATFKRSTWSRQEEVAVKKLRCCDTTNQQKLSHELTHEVKVMAGLSHENIVQFMGFVEDFENGKAWIVLSWEPNGNVSEFLATGQWEIPERLSLIKDTFAGLEYLHTRQPPICHGDLKSLNILVSASYHAIITDFGSARLLNDPSDNGSNKASGQELERNLSTEKDCSPIHLAATGSLLTLTGPAWSLRWAPPEAVSGNRPSLPSDIWAAGWVCWEIMTDQLPFPELNSPDVIATMVVEGNVPSAREDAQLSQIVALSSLMKDCWAFNPKDRPTTSKCYREMIWMPSTPPLGGASGSKASSTNLLLEMGHIQYNQGNREGAASLFTQGLAAARSAGDQRAIAQALDWLATIYRLQRKYKEAKELLVQSQEIYMRINYDQGHAKTLYGLGNVDYVQSKFTEAQDYFTRAQDIFTRIDDERGQAAALVGLGHVYHAQSKHPEAEKSYTQARDISLRIGCNQTQGNSLRGLGHVYYKTYKYTKAEEFYAQAEDIYSRIGDRLGQANILSGLGDVYYMQSKYSDARQSFTRAHDIYAQTNDLPWQANALERMGLTYRAQSKYKEAEESYSRAQEIFSRIGDMRGQANVLRALDDIHQSQNRDVAVAAYYSKARDIYDKAWSLFR